jgi:hypothetical protein
VSPSKPCSPEKATFRKVGLVDGFGRHYFIGIPSNPTHRQEGRTMLQMLDAPQGALFVWPDQRSIFYPKAMQKALRREDLRVVSVHQFAHPGFADGNTAQVVIDHAVWLMDWPVREIGIAIDISARRGLFKWPD